MENPQREAKIEQWLMETRSTQTAHIPRDKMKADRVYFIQSGNGPIKIGWSNGIEQRLATLQMGNPEKLTILRQFRGDIWEEKALQRKFKNFKIHGEWFTPTQEILDFIKNTKDEDFLWEVDAYKHKADRIYKIKSTPRKKRKKNA